MTAPGPILPPLPYALITYPNGGSMTKPQTNRLQAYARVMALAWPTIFENIMVTMVNYVDTAMVGSLGKEATSAVAINTSPMWLINNISMAISIGGTVMVARNWGAGDHERAGSFARQAAVLGAALGAVMMLAVFLLAPYIPRWMGADAAILPTATIYLRTLSISFIPHYAGLMMSGILRGSGDTKTPMRVSMGVNLLNVAGNFLLIYPIREIAIFPRTWPIHFSFTMWGANLGVFGAAIASAASMALAGVFLLFYLSRHQSALRFTARQSYRLHKNDLRDMMRVGLPAAGERIVISLGSAFYTVIVANLGVAQLAAHHLAITAESICYNPVYGFSTAATTMTGQELGAGRPDEAERYGKINIRFGLILMAAAGLVLYFFAEPLIRIFTPDPEVIRLGADVLRIIAFVEPFFALSIVASGALRGAGDTVAPLIIGMGSMWGLRLTLAFVLVRVFHLGLSGAWIAMAVDLTARGLLTYLRFRSGKWKAVSEKLRASA